MTRLWRTGLVLLVSNLLAVLVGVGLGKQGTSRQVVYDANIGNDHDIFVLDVNHRLTHNLTRSAGIDSNPAWSPDGRYIAFESWRGGVRSAYVMNADGSNPRRLTGHTDASEYAPRWTADGTAILFRYYKRPESAIFQVNPDGSNLRRVQTLGEYQPTITSTNIVSLPFAGPELTRQSHEAIQLPVSIRLAENPTLRWSSDRQLGAFLSLGILVAPEVYILDSSDNSLTQITADGFIKHNLSWRP